MGRSVISATLIISAFVVAQCLPDLAEVNDNDTEELVSLDDRQPWFNRLGKRFDLHYKCKYARGKYPHEEDCSLYYDCSTGKMKTVSCPKGEFFDAGKTKCLEKKLVKCKNGGKGGSGSSESGESHEKFKCEKKSDGNFPHESDCKKYFACKKGKSKEHTCPKKELYDVGERKCRPQEEVHCGNKKNPYDPDSETDFECPKSIGSFAHEDDCSRYYSCKDDLSKLRMCPKYKLFDVEKEKCENQEDVHCGDKINPYDPDSRTKFKCPKSKGSFAHENDCTKYYSCKDDLARLRACPKEKLFDAHKEKCENHEEVHCGIKINPYDPESITDFECPKSKGTFAHEDDCSKYYSCKDHLAKLRTCPKKKLYDLEAGECRNYEDVHCGNKHNPYDISGKKIDFQCPKTTGEFPHEKECNKYYSCKYGLAKLKTCPEKKLFDAEREECRDSKKVKCGKRLDPEGKTFNCPLFFAFLRSYPDPSDCKKYYVCTLGEPKSKTCPRKERFDPEKKICRNENKVKCDVDSEGEEEEFVCPPSKSGNFSVYDDCSLYYTCLSKESHPKSCPPEQLFDIKTARCEDHQQVNCDSRFNPYEDESEISDEVDYKCPRQEGLFPHEEDCRSYYNCHKGVATVESCPAGKLFDVFKRRCANEEQVDCDDPIDPSSIHTKHRRHRYRYYWCPRAWGHFFHRSHCGRYYHCWHRRPSFRSCSRGWFFDISRRRCYEEDFVDCGRRRRRDEDEDSRESDNDDEFKCPSSRGKYAHEIECNKYYECDRSKASLKTCRKGYLFDVRRRQCESHYRVDCGDRIDGEGVVDENNDFECPSSRGNYPYLDDCSRYFSCSDKKPTLKACPVGQMYDVERGDCHQEQRVDCGGRPKPDGTKQPDEEDGFRCPTASGNYAHESDCKKYYSCSNNLVTERKCRKGELFDSNRGSCERANRVDCGGRFDDSSSSQEDSSEDTFRCPTSRGNHPHPDCQMYYSCSNNKFTLKKCPEGQLYDVRRRDCDRWDKVDCGRRKSRFDESTTVTPSTARITSSTKSISDRITSTVDIKKTTVSGISDRETEYITKEPGKLSTSGVIDGSTTPAVKNGTQSETEEPISHIVTGNPTTAEPSTGIDDDSKTICATSSGLFPHKKDCKKYYRCVNSIPILMTCNGSELFDARKSRCAREVDCGRRIKPNDKNEEKEELDYRCPSTNGNYPHQNCQWYYVCSRNKHTLKKCPENKLFDTIKHRCEPNNDVDCGGRQLPGDKITNRPTMEEFTTVTQKTHQPGKFTTTDYQGTDITGIGTGKITDLSTKKPATGKSISPGVSEATGTSPLIDNTSSTEQPATGKGTGSTVGDLTNYTGLPVTSTRTKVTSTNAGFEEETTSSTKWPATRRPVTGTDSNIEEVTNSKWPITGTGSNIGEVTEWPVTNTKRPVTDSNIGEITGTEHPGISTGMISGSDLPASSTKSPLTDPNVGKVTSSGLPETGKDFITGDVINPVTGTRMPFTSTESNIGNESSSKSPVTGTNPDTGRVTGSDKPATSSEISITDSNIGEATSSEEPLSRSRKPFTGEGSSTVNLGSTEGPATGSRQPSTDTSSSKVPYTEWPVTGTRGKVTGTESVIGETTESKQPATENRSLVTGTDSDIEVSTSNWKLTSSSKLITQNDSNTAETTKMGSPATEKDKDSNMEITGTDYSTKGVTKVSTESIISSVTNSIATRDGETTGSKAVSETSSGGKVQQTTASLLISENTRSTHEGSTSNPHTCTTDPFTGDTICEENFICPTTTGYYPHEEDCKKYYECIHSRPQLMTCSGRQKFDAKTNRCTSSKVDCGSRYDPDGSGESGGMKRDCPTSKEGHYPTKHCEQYLACSKKKYKIQQCPFGELFDAPKRKCQPSYLVDCGGRRDPYGESTTVAVSTSGGGSDRISSSVSGDDGNTQDITSVSHSINDVTTRDKITSEAPIDQTERENISSEIATNKPFSLSTVRETEGSSIIASEKTMASKPVIAEVTTVDTSTSKSTLIADSSLTASEVTTQAVKNGTQGFTKSDKWSTETTAAPDETRTNRTRTTVEVATASIPIKSSMITANGSVATNSIATEDVTQGFTPDIGKATKTTNESQSPNPKEIVTETPKDTTKGFTADISKLTKPTAEKQSTTAEKSSTEAATTASTVTTPSKPTCEVIATSSTSNTPKVTKPQSTTEDHEGILYCPEPNGLFPHPDPHKWVHCSNWEPHIKDCPGSLVFNRKLKVCSWTISFAQVIPSK